VSASPAAVDPIPVLHVCDKFGVAGSSTHGVSRLFSWWFPRFNRRFAVSLCGLKSPEPGSQALEAQGIPVTHLGRGPFDPRILFQLVALARRQRARILHVHGYAAADFGRLAARLVGAKLVLHEHFADRRLPAYQAVADRLLARLTDRAIAVSRSTADFLSDERYVPRERVRIIYNGAPLAEFAPGPPERGRAARRSLGVPDAAPLVGIVGRVNAQKAHRFLVDAMPAVLARAPETYLAIIGDGDLVEPLRQQARERGVAERVIFAGHRADVPAVLQALDVFCISSTYEGTPLALFEAFAGGKAVVSTAVDGCREVVEDGVTGLLVPPSDPPRLAEALIRVLVDSSLRERLARAAIEASKRYDIAACVQQIEALYDELLPAPAAEA
jgi:glycosyltransferase involved in cell wall biosynthesis